MTRIKLWMALCVGAAALAAQSADRPAGVPEDAVKTADGYRYTDAQGQQWIYRRTPLGVARAQVADPAKAGAAKKTPAADDGIRATDHGDTVAFERPGPFGTYRWERKKSDMDARERAAYERATAAESSRN